MLGVFNPVSSSINIKQIISELPVTLRIGIIALILFGICYVIASLDMSKKVNSKMDNNSGSISIGKESVFAGKETGEKYSDFDNYASGQYDYYHGVLNVKINKMDNAEYNYLKGKTLAFIKK